jgi:hypothetical protein
VSATRTDDRQLASAERYCRDLAGDSPEARRLCADPDVQRCLRFWSGEEPTLDALLACYAPYPERSP